MTFDIDAWIPNFTLFIYILAPFILMLFAIMILASRWLKLEDKGPKKSMTFAEMLGLIPALYLLQPIYEIGEYLYGTRTGIVDRLFLDHFPIFMFLVLCVGIGQVGYYWLSMGDAGEVAG